MIKTRRRSPTMNPLPFQLDPEPATETLTSYGGVPLVLQAFRSLGLPQAVERHVQIKQRERGYDEATFVESFVILLEETPDRRPSQKRNRCLSHRRRPGMNQSRSEAEACCMHR